MLKTNRPIPFENMRLIVFDLDGTLVDSQIDLANSVNAMLREFKEPELPLEVIATYIGDGAPMLVRRALGDPDDQSLVEDALEYFLRYYREHKLDTTYVYDGVFDSLNEFQRALPQSKMAVLTNKPVNPARAIVGTLGLQPFFFQCYGGNSFHTKKPEPHGIRELMKEAGGIAPQQTVIIGDSHVDILTARNSGIYSVGCTFGLSPHTLADVPPDVLVDHASEWAELLPANMRS